MYTHTHICIYIYMCVCVPICDYNPQFVSQAREVLLCMHAHDAGGGYL